MRNEYQDQVEWFELVQWSHTKRRYVPVGPDRGFDTPEDAHAYADQHYPITPVEVRRRTGLPE